MIDIDIANGKKGRLVVRSVDETGNPVSASRTVVDAIQSLLSTSYSPKQGGFLISFDDFPNFLQRVETIDNSEISGHISDAAKVLIAQHQEKTRTIVSLKKDEPQWELLDKIDGWKTRPYPDQMQCLQFHISRRRSLEGSETGIGKTLTTLYTYLYWKSIGVAQHGLILCTNSGKLDWEKEVEQHTNLTCLSVGNGTEIIRKDLDKYQAGKFDLLILHYDCLFQDARSRISIFDLVRGLPIDFIVLDEAHMLKNPTSKRHKRVVELVETYGDIPLVCATGTAIDGNPRSAWAPMKIIEGRPNHFFPSYVDFSRYFVVREPRFFYRKKVMVDVGFRNLKKLKDMMEPVMIRFLKSEVMGRPSKIYQNRIVTLTGDQEKLYNQVKRQIRNELVTSDGDSISIVNAATKILRLRQILNHPSIIRDVEKYNGGSAKYNELDFIVEEILSNPEAQLLVWTQWKAAVDLLVNRYKEHKSIAYYGGSDDRAVRDSVLSKKSRIIIAIPEKAGTSIDWLKGIRTAVYLEKPWSLTLYRQSLDRIDRRVNVDPALIITIAAENSVDGFVDAVLQKHQAMFDAITIDDETLLTLGKAELLRYLD